MSPPRMGVRPARPRPAAAALALTTLLVAGLTATAPAALADEAPQTAAKPQAGGGGVADGLVLDRPGESVVTRREVTPIAPGLTRTSFDRIGRAGWIRGNVLVADLNTKGLSVDYLSSGKVTTRQTVSEQARNAGAVAAINGDYFDMNASEAPLGAGVSRDKGLIHAPIEGWNQAVTVGTDGLARMAQVFLEGNATLPGGREVPLSGVNTYGLPEGGVGVFTSAWGNASLAHVAGGSGNVVEVEIREGRVVAVRDRLGGGPIADGTTLLVGREGGADRLRALKAGDPVGIGYKPRASFGEVAVAVGGYQVLVRDGVATESGENDGNEPNARTAVGFSADGRRMYLVTIDGRQADSPGINLSNLAVLMRDMGAHNALNMDGGGSADMVARLPGQAQSAVVSSPSDNGGERPVANGLGLFTTPGSGETRGFRLRPVPTVDTGVRVFPGLHRTVRALPHDESFGAVKGAVPKPKWSTDTAAKLTVAGNGTEAVVTGRAPGPASVTIKAKGAEDAKLPLTVLGEPVRVTAGGDPVGLAAPGASAHLAVTGYDATGHAAPVEAADVKVTGGEGIVEVTPAPDGTLNLKALADGRSATLKLTVGTLETAVAVTVGMTEKSFADFSNAAAWKSGNDRAPGGSIAPAPGPDGKPGLSLAYDFTKSTGTRGQYAIAPEGIVLPGQPRALTMWIEGDGNGAWPRIQYRTAAGVVSNLDAPMVTWKGWQKVEFPVPAGVQYPLTFQRFRLMETNADRLYTGRLGLSDLRVQVPPDVQLPKQPYVKDPVILTNGTVDAKPLRVAVMSDAQFVARDPNSDRVRDARRTLREVAAAKPEFMVITGDFVDEAAPEDFALARKLLDEFDQYTNRTIPWHYVPGNHEVMGPGNIANFKAAFGETSKVFDHKGTRFVTVDSSMGTLRGGGFEQVAGLRKALDDAAKDPNITGLLLFDHHPTNDPLPDKGSQLGDRKEARMVEQWLGAFRADSGKSAAMVSGHVGAFHAASVDGVPYLINGNSSKGPAAEPDRGGFVGWTMLGIDPAKGRVTDPFAVPADDAAWLRAEVKPYAESVALKAPATLGVLNTRPVTTTMAQDGRTVPVAWPVTAQWGGTGVHIGSPASAPRGAIAAYDPAYATLTGLRPGVATLTVTVGGVKAEQPVKVGDVDPAACTTTIRGSTAKPLAVTSGITCLDNATVKGPILVQPGAGLIATNSTVTGPISSRGATVLVLTDTTVGGPVAASGSTGPVMLLWSGLGGPADLSLNRGITVVAGNTVAGPLSCRLNTTPPTNGGIPNKVSGPKSDQCGAL
ncbi:phosphodiester glycosidase family protein [Embleya sp. NPDC056575]|uniref:phosphodiester glycosidase family protein n=1 Tax=unclassified Embleya TaxID=2699296 RepID=UPI0036C02283